MSGSPSEPSESMRIFRLRETASTPPYSSLWVLVFREKEEQEGEGDDAVDDDLARRRLLLPTPLPTLLDL